MNLRTRAWNHGYTLKSLAKAVECSPTYLSQINIGMRKPGLDLCLRIEKATDGGITRQQLRPDWCEKRK